MNKGGPVDIKISLKTIEVTKGETMTIEEMFCPNCGKQLHTVYNRCRDCGQKFKKVESEV